MSFKDSVSDLVQAVDNAQSIVIVQAENPDADSLASSLALEDMFESMGKQVTMFCPVDIPRHLRYLEGSDRVVNMLPNKIDVSIIVDTAQFSLLESIEQQNHYNIFKSSDIYVFDHHSSGVDLPFDHSPLLSSSAVATGELIFEIASEAGWDISSLAADMMASSIMSDSLGLTTVATTSRSIEVLSKLVTLGANIAASNEARRILMKKSQELTLYKGRLLERLEFVLNGRMALIIIPWEEIEEYSDQYNPTMLVMDDMKLVEGVEIAIGLKLYPDGKITGKLRSNNDFPHCTTLAEAFGGGGHPYAAGFKLKSAQLEDVLSKLKTTYAEIT